MPANLPYIMAFISFGLISLFCVVIWLIFFSKKICETCGEKIHGKEFKVTRNNHLWRVCDKCNQTISEGKPISYLK